MNYSAKLRPEERAAINLDNWLVHPNGKFSFLHAEEFVPTVTISPRVAILRSAPATGALPATPFVTADGRVASLAETLASMEVDSLLVSKRKEIVLETHASHVDPGRPHLLFSVSKSITGLLAGVAVDDGCLSTADRVSDFVRELDGSGFASATVRDLLDMTVDIVFNEDYADPDSDFWRYRRAVRWSRSAGRDETMLEMLASIKAGRSGHGRRFSYISAVTDVLGAVIERSTGVRYSDFLHDRMLAPLGCGDLVLVGLDGEGHARATGGIAMSARDLLRVGQMISDGGRRPNGARIVSEGWIKDMSVGATRQAWMDGDYPDMLPKGHYRSCWYDESGGRGPLVALGVFGQFVWVDAARDIVIVCLSSRPVMSDARLSKEGLHLFSQLAEKV
jgi:CubicO group peptidase (beta-lactamase class C family)